MRLDKQPAQKAKEVDKGGWDWFWGDMESQKKAEDVIMKTMSKEWVPTEPGSADTPPGETIVETSTVTRFEELIPEMKGEMRSESKTEKEVADEPGSPINDTTVYKEESEPKRPETAEPEPIQEIETVQPELIREAETVQSEQMQEAETGEEAGVRATPVSPMEPEVQSASDHSIPSRALSNEAHRFLEKFESSIAFYEETFSLGVFSADRGFLWKSRRFSDELLTSLSAHQRDLHSFFTGHLLNQSEKIRAWSIEYEKAIFISISWTRASSCC